MSLRDVKRRGEGDRFNDKQQMETISLLEQKNLPSMSIIASQFGMDEKKIRKLKSNKDEIRERTLKVDQPTQESTFCSSHGRFLELQWIEACRCM